MHRGRWTRTIPWLGLPVILAILVLAWLAGGVTPVGAATRFFDPAFQQQWQAGEALAPNFWGPLATAREGSAEPYAESKGGQRVVQYFDKGRMEIINSTTRVVTNGLLATEMLTGNQQMGDAVFMAVPPPAFGMAGDPDNPGPTYAQLKVSGLLAGKPRYDVVVQGPKIPYALTPAGNLETPGPGSTLYPGGAPFHPALGLDTYDNTTQHNVPFAFARYRDRAGLATIGLAISEPFWTRVKVGGVMKDVLVQAFERRILTFTPTNAPDFQVEMGNIGQHYYRWRYGG